MEKLTQKELLKMYPSNLVMVTYEFETPLYIAPLQGVSIGGIATTDKKEAAEKWNELDGTKLAYYKAVTGYRGLVFENI